MAGRIRGITIEIGGDTKGLVDSLKNASKASSEVQKELKDINKVLKFDSTNTDLLAQKQKALKDNVEAVKTQLEEEEKALQELDKAGDSDKNAKAQEALQRQIVETKAKLKEAEAELKSFGSVGAQQAAEVGKKFQEVGAQVEKVGQGLTKNVSAPLAAVGGASVAAFKDVDSGFDTIIKKTGASGDELEDMKGIFNNIAGTVPGDMGEIGSAIGEVNTRFGSTGEELEGLSTQFLKFAKLNDQDVSTAVDQTQKALTAYGKGADDAAGFLDVMNKVSQNTGVSVDALQNGIVQNSAAFQEMGLSLEQSAIFMGDLEKSGADSSSVMSGLAKALKTASADGTSLDDVLAELQYSIQNGTDETEALNLAYEYFGKSGAQVFNAVRNGSLDFTNLATATIDATDSISTTFDQTIDPVDEFMLAFQQLKLVGADLGTSLLTVLKPAIEKLQEVIGIITEKWKGLSPEMQQNIVKIGLVVAAIGPALVVIGKVISTVGTIMTLIPKLSAAIGLITSPVGLVVAGFAALVAAGVLIYQNWDTIKEKAIEIWDKVKEYFNTLIEAIKEKFQIFGEIKDYIVERFEALRDSVKEIWEALKTWIEEKITAIKDKFTEVFQGIKEKVVEKVKALRDSVKEIWEALGTWISDKITAIKDKFSEIFQTIKEKVVEKTKALRDSFKEIWNALKTWVDDKLSAIKEKFSTIFQSIKEKVVEKVKALRDSVKGVVDGLKTSVDSKLESIKTKFSNIWESIKTTTSNAFNSIKEKITQPIEKAKELVTSAIEKIKGLFPLSMGKIFSGIQLPHFKISGGQIPWGIGGKGVKPSVSIEWYKKAMANGMILDRPTIFGMDSSGRFLAGGEAGSETVVGTNSLMGMIQRATQGSQIDPALIYQAVKEGAEAATLRAYVGVREVTAAVDRGATSSANSALRFAGE